MKEGLRVEWSHHPLGEEREQEIEPKCISGAESLRWWNVTAGFKPGFFQIVLRNQNQLYVRP